MFGFGFSQQQTPTSVANASATPAPEQAKSQELAAPAPETTPAPSPQAEAAPTLSDPATLAIARIHSPNAAANFRAAPSLQSPVLGVLMHSDLVELSTERHVQQDGITWVPLRWRGQYGWMAQNFIGGSPNAQL
nr:SH3 domain-containing protein [Phormidium sp. FACHB-592]